MARVWEAVIGIEVHAELSTRSKVYCGCANAFGAEPNTHVCPVCLGLPGSMPVLNRRAVEYAIMAALALNCQITAEGKFDRKHYFYPDLPKGFQISQYDTPIGHGGFVEIEDGGEVRPIGIRRVHLEEDTGKSTHDPVLGTLIDYNRAGVPLIEIVSEPDLRTAAQAVAYLSKLRLILKYLGVSDVKMQEGSMRCEVNISLREKGSDQLGNLVEIKNIGSFRGVERSIAYEIARQREILEQVGTIARETRGWDEANEVTVAQRRKEQASDYRYFPEPDLVPLRIDAAWQEKLRRSLPELPDAKRARWMREYGLPAYDAGRLVEAKATADFFDTAVSRGGDPKAVANWIIGELLRVVNLRGGAIEEMELADLPTSPEHLAAMLALLEKGTISSKLAKTVFEEMCDSGRDPETIVKEKGLVQISDEAELEQAVDRVLDENPRVVADYRAGKKGVAGFLVGQVMKATGGRANPQLVNELIRRKLD
ncbi:MAG: Asp-tRNA(Asn)/Glu-tRNA(Gln) amidotransferase subunit GatB [Bacillota bacterium]